LSSSEIGWRIARSRITRLLAIAGVAFLVAGCHDEAEEAARVEAPPPTQHFRSRPDLRPPVVEITQPARDTSPGYIFIAPKRKVAQTGPMILDDSGALVWFRPLDARGATDFRAQRYDGRPVLTWWRGKSERGIGEGHYVIVDDAYREIATVSAGNGLTGGLHEFLITERDTALITIYNRLPADLSEIGGPKEGAILEGVVQELEIATGRVLFEWRSSEHVALDESYAKVPSAAKGAKADPYDYFHINSVDVDVDGNFLISARNTQAVYKLARKDGRVLWRLGGKRSDYRLGPGVRFAWQHDARRQPDGTLTLYDNVADEEVKNRSSRVLVLRLDDEGGRASLVRSYEHPRRLLATTQGSAQFLPGGHVFVGWGAQPYFTEFDRNGRVLLDGRFGVDGTDSYRAFRFAWIGSPADNPTVALEREGGARYTAYASWNGATEVVQWQVLAGPDAQRLRPITDRAKEGFETAIPIVTPEEVVQVRALNRRGAIIGTSRPVVLANVR
jgi:hypothetical protein